MYSCNLHTLRQGKLIYICQYLNGLKFNFDSYNVYDRCYQLSSIRNERNRTIRTSTLCCHLYNKQN
jgi:hypothetical protein